MTEAAPVQDPAQEERSSVQQILETKEYETNPELLPWYTKELEEPSPATRDIFMPVWWMWTKRELTSDGT